MAGVHALADSRLRAAPPARAPILAGLTAVAALILVLVVAVPGSAPPPPMSDEPSRTGPPAAISTTSPTSSPPAPVPTPEVDGPVIGCSGETLVTVHDQTGMVDECSGSQIRGEGDDRPIVENTGGRLTISWSGSICLFELYLSAKQDRYALEIRELSKSCRLQGVRHTVNLEVNARVDAADVDIELTTSEEERPLISRLIKCSHYGPLGGADGNTFTRLPVMVVDNTRSVEDCVTGPTTLSVPSVVVQNASATEALRISWPGSRCDASVTFTFDWGGSPYRLQGERQQGDCDEAAAYTMTMSLSRMILAGSVDASISASPSAFPTPTVRPPYDVSACPYADDSERLTEVSIVDHSGLVIGCDAFVELSSPGVFVEAANVGSELTMLDVRWEISHFCTSMPVRLEFWGPLAYEPPFGSMPPFVLQIDEPQSSEAPEGCVDSVATQGVRLALGSAVLARSVEAFRTLGGRGIDVNRLGDHSLTLELAAGSLEYAADESIDISASTLYSGPRDRVTLSGLDPNPGFGFQQLDGNVRQTGGGDWICQDLELRRDVPSTVAFRKSGLFIPSDFPETATMDAYWSDPELRLPPGLYRFFARAGGNMDGSCMGGDGRSLGTRTSIVVEVR